MSRKHRRQLEKNTHDTNVIGFHDTWTKNSMMFCLSMLNRSGNHDQDFQDIFSVPRAAPVTTRKGLKCGESLDCGMGGIF